LISKIGDLSSFEFGLKEKSPVLKLLEPFIDESEPLRHLKGEFELTESSMRKLHIDFLISVFFEIY
jgi:hypothetical protein